EAQLITIQQLLGHSSVQTTEKYIQYDWATVHADYNRNNYHLKPKNSTIYTPSEVSEFIFNLLKDKIINGVILDPCSGTDPDNPGISYETDEAQKFTANFGGE
ncbi:39626_t:CDS:2, partial [Gigaspora margarita]